MPHINRQIDLGTGENCTLEDLEQEFAGYVAFLRSGDNPGVANCNMVSVLMDYILDSQCRDIYFNTHKKYDSLTFAQEALGKLEDFVMHDYLKAIQDRRKKLDDLADEWGVNDLTEQEMYDYF